MRKLFSALTDAFRAHQGKIDEAHYRTLAARYATLFEDSETIFLLLQASGYPIERDDEGFYLLKTYFTPIEEQRFCIVDIETNGAKPSRAQIIEVGAVMVQGGKIIDRMESFVACAYLPEYISKVTGIEPEDLKDAPSRREVLTRLRAFLGDAIFVAHNAAFDFGFLDASFERFGLGSLGNQTLCTIDLAKRTFKSERYGLAYLRETLGLERYAPTHHRAYADAISAYHVMQKSLKNLPHSITSADMLIRFSKSKKIAT